MKRVKNFDEIIFRNSHKEITVNGQQFNICTGPLPESVRILPASWRDYARFQADLLITLLWEKGEIRVELLRDGTIAETAITKCADMWFTNYETFQQLCVAVVGAVWIHYYVGE